MTCREFGPSEAWGTVWRGLLLSAAVGGVLYATMYEDEAFWPGVANVGATGALLTGLWTAGSGLLAASRAPRGSAEADAAVLHALTGFFSGVGGSAAIFGVTTTLRRPQRRRRRLPA